MDPALLIALLWIAFAATHTVPASAALRPKLIERLGTGAYLGLYSLVSLLIFVPLVTVYLRHLHEGALLWSLSDVTGVHQLAVGLAGAGFALLVASFFQPSPFTIGAPAPPEPRGLTRITRHPLFMPLLPLSIAHLLVHGWLTDVVFFAGLGTYTIVGCLHQDRRKRLTDGDRLQSTFDQSSFLPFWAVVTGRGRLVLSELPWLGLAIGAGAAYGFYRLHPAMFRG